MYNYVLWWTRQRKIHSESTVSYLVSVWLHNLTSLNIVTSGNLITKQHRSSNLEAYQTESSTRLYQFSWWMIYSQQMTRKTGSGLEIHRYLKPNTHSKKNNKSRGSPPLNSKWVMEQMVLSFPGCLSPLRHESCDAPDTVFLWERNDDR